MVVFDVARFWQSCDWVVLVLNGLDLWLVAMWLWYVWWWWWWWWLILAMMVDFMDFGYGFPRFGCGNGLWLVVMGCAFSFCFLLWVVVVVAGLWWFFYYFNQSLYYFNRSGKKVEPFNVRCVKIDQVSFWDAKS